MRTALAYFDGERGHLTVVEADGLVRQIKTAKASPGRAIQIDDGKDLPIMRYGCGRYGPVLKWGSDKATMGERFAGHCLAKLFSSKSAYDEAVTKAIEQRASHVQEPQG
jgi:hypothetical protein